MCSQISKLNEQLFFPCMSGRKLLTSHIFFMWLYMCFGEKMWNYMLINHSVQCFAYLSWKTTVLYLNYDESNHNKSHIKQQMQGVRTSKTHTCERFFSVVIVKFSTNKILLGICLISVLIVVLLFTQLLKKYTFPIFL